MAKWTISITVHNALERTLKLDDMRVPWGVEEKRDETIAPGGTGRYTIYAPAGTAWGPEYYLTFSDVPPVKDGKVMPKYGTVNIHVDIPYTSSNKLEVTEGGVLAASGYAEMSAHQHDYITGLTISRK